MIFFKRAPLRSIGKMIAAAEFQTLKAGFTSTFPGETASVLLPKQAILECIASYPGLSGISFHYGLTDAGHAGPLSRKIIMAPCKHTTDANGIPDRVLFRDGYVSNDGFKVSLDEFWTLLGNHVEHACKSRRIPVLSKVQRAYFWGIDRIRTLLELDDCGGLIFHFGYNVAHSNPNRRYQNILEVAGEDLQGRRIYMEYGHPPGEGGEGGGTGDSSICFSKELIARFGGKNAERQLSSLRAFRDSFLPGQPGGYALYEMYYYLSRPISLAIQSLPGRDETWHGLYTNEMQQVLTLIEEQRMEQAFTVCKETMQRLLHNYVLVKRQRFNA